MWPKAKQRIDTIYVGSQNIVCHAHSYGKISQVVLFERKVKTRLPEINSDVNEIKTREMK